MSSWLPRQSNDIALLILRVVGAGTMALAHGFPKLKRFPGALDSFPDPIGLGSAVSYLCTVGAEFGCAMLIVLGLGTRLAALPLVFTMLVAAFVVHGGDPMAKKELPLLYASVFMALFFLGGGAYRIRASFLSRLDRWS